MKNTVSVKLQIIIINPKKQMSMEFFTLKTFMWKASSVFIEVRLLSLA